MSTGREPRVVVLDASVIINLINVGLLALLAALIGYRFVIPNTVYERVSEPKERAALDQALASGALRRVDVSDPAVQARVAEFRARGLGQGAADCLALAAVNNWIVASDTRKAFQRVAGEVLDFVWGTPGVMLEFIHAGRLSIWDADAAIEALAAKFKFRVGFRSFAELIGKST